MGDNFFYRWKSEDVWAIIEPIVPGKDKTRVRLEFDKLKQQGIALMMVHVTS